MKESEAGAAAGGIAGERSWYHRPWEAADRAALWPMVRAFLRVSAERGGDVLPTDRSVGYLVDLGMDLAAAGDPCYVAVEPPETVVGYIEWGGLVRPVDERWRTCYTFGSYVEPRCRGRGIARGLRFAARDRCRETGFERIVGPVHVVNEAGIREFLERGAWPTSMQMEMMI